MLLGHGVEGRVQRAQPGAGAWRLFFPDDAAKLVVRNVLHPLPVKGGGAGLTMDYKGNNYKYNNLGYAAKNFVSDFKPGFGAGSRIRLLNYVNSGTRVFIQGGGFFFKADDKIKWNKLDGGIFTKEREITWVDLYAGLGVSKRLDYIDLTFGLGFSEIKWEIKDIDVTESGTTISRTPLEPRDSFEVKYPVFGFFGLDFVLPYEYRISAQVGIWNTDEAKFSVAVSQGLEKD